jgi:flagellar basal-body rod modification protein FlgD
MNALVAFRANALGHLSTPPSPSGNLAAQQSSTGPSGSVKATGGASAAKAAGDDAIQSVTSELRRDTFLQLLVLQLQNQDPTKPVDNSEMIAQLAQFSALEAQTTLNENFEELSENFAMLSGNVDQLNFISAQGLLGDEVQGFALNGEIVEGVVESVHLEGNIVVLHVNGELVPMSGVLSISENTPSVSKAAGTEV